MRTIEQEKLDSPEDTFIFHRKEGWYPLVLPEATVLDNALLNLGTIKVTRVSTGETIWEASK